MSVLAHAPIHVVTCTPAERASGFLTLGKALRAQLAGPCTDGIADLVLAKEPSLQSLETLVRAVCTRPYEIRRPKDLARACGLGIALLKGQAKELGFTRIEHLLVCIRMVACEQLVAQRHLPLQTARRLVGIADSSNSRRQFRRARRGSPDALRKLRSLVASLLLLVAPPLEVARRDKALCQSDLPHVAAATPVGIASPVGGEIVRRGEFALSIRALTPSAVYGSWASLA